MSINPIIYSEILKRVEKPSRYLGTELNSVHKDKKDVKHRFALVFPDIYDLGLGNLGLHILYAIMNKHPDVWAERAYSPAMDMEKELRERGMPLFALESRDSLADFDGLGFTLQSELTYTNILNILSLSGIPLRTEDRTEEDPLTFCGGPAVFNPEPMVYFMDFFVIGDGEDIVNEIIEVFRAHEGKKARLAALAQIEGIYVPSLFPVDLMEDGQIIPSDKVPKIRKRLAKDLNAAEFPVDYIVPFTKQVHDRISLEVLRGCTQGCRFCQAGMTTRPVRERSIDNIEKLMERTLAATGYEEVSLVSLSTCDYSQVRTMVQKVVEKAAPQNVSVSLPSLRLDSFSVEIADIVAGIRRTGLTFAPEAASPRLRAVINKWIPDEELLNMSSQAFKLGWDHVKLYFMIGLPTERDDDVDAIADLTLKTLAIGKKLNPRAKVNTGVSTFVPKPFTPFQWAEQITPNEARRRQEILWLKFNGNRSIKFGRHPANETFLEGLVSRADRKAGALIERAYQLGARFEGWDEHRNMGAWYQAIEDVKYDVDFQFRERKTSERLPWDHLDIMIPKQWFIEDWQRALELKYAEDCRHSKCHRCGVIDEERELCASMLRTSIDGRKSEKNFERSEEALLSEPLKPKTPPKRVHDADPVQRLLFRVAITGEARFLSHLEIKNAWVRTLRRGRIPIAYSKGFNPQPKLSFESARPTAEESLGSYMDIYLKVKEKPQEILARLKGLVAPGFSVLSVKEIPFSASSLMGAVAGMDYIFYVPKTNNTLEDTVEEILGKKEILIERKRKVKKRKANSYNKGRWKKEDPMRSIDVRPNIKEIKFSVPNNLQKEGYQAIAVGLDRIELRGLRPSEFLKLLGFKHEECHVLRLRTRFSESVLS